MAAAEQDHDVTPAADDPAERRHRALLRMLGHLKDALECPLDKRELLRASALAGYNANPDPNFSGADAGSRVLWADEDAEALLAVGSDEQAGE